MNFELRPITEPGVRLVALAEAHADDFATRAEQHDRDGSFPFENITAMAKSGVMAACVPQEFGGLGVESVHDYVLGINRLGRGDGATAIAANMHIFRPWRLTRAWRAAMAEGEQRQASTVEHLLRRVGSGDLVIAALLSEPGTDLLHPMVAATPSDGGRLLNGHKIFGTMSPAADLFDVACRVPDGRGGYRRALATIPRGRPGMDVKNNWDALGMRASGSHDVVFTDCFVGEDELVDTGPWGSWSEPFLAGNLVITMGLVGAFLGIAEAARDLIVGMLKDRRKGPGGRTLAERPSIQHTVAEIEVALATARAMLARTAMISDEFLRVRPAGRIPLDELHALMKDFQCTKLAVTRKAVDIVDLALTASGGAGYLSKNPLSRLYRDVRAGPFMQPFSPNEAFVYIGKVALGLDPALES